MFNKKNIKLLFSSIHMKPLPLISALIALLIIAIGLIYRFIGFIRHPSIGWGIFFVACILEPIFHKHFKEWFKNKFKK
jgi:hypothetical protein